MDESPDGALKDLIASRRVAALGTLHDGAPYVSMVPFALLPDGSAFLIHVSGLSAHTGDMLKDPRVSLLVIAPESPEHLAQELPRVTILGRAAQVPEPSGEYDTGMARYLERFPDAAPMFQLGDFSLFTITPEHVRWIGGFAGAESLTPEAFAKAVRAKG
jgi:heme oxygenase (biliverdin-IX-beta and delta-forming)